MKASWRTTANPYLDSLPIEAGQEYRGAEWAGYKIGSDGTVWTCKKRTGFREHSLTNHWRRLKSVPDDFGYQLVTFSENGLKRKFAIHVLVATAFHGPCPEGLVCRHLDGNPGNNRADNLAWGTYEENEADKLAHGTRLCGESVFGSKLRESAVRDILTRWTAGESWMSICKAYPNLERSAIRNVLIGKTWLHVRQKMLDEGFVLTATKPSDRLSRQRRLDALNRPCPKGHPRTEANIVIKEGRYLECRQCNIERLRKRREAKKATNH